MIGPFYLFYIEYSSKQAGDIYHDGKSSLELQS